MWDFATLNAFWVAEKNHFRMQNAFWVPPFRVIPKAKRVLGSRFQGHSEGKTHFGYQRKLGLFFAKMLFIR